MLDLYVINLRHRNDRLEKMKTLFKDFNLITVDAIEHTNGQIGCFLSHKKCIQLAKDNNMKNIIVIEDDCEPINNFNNRIIEIKKYLDSYRNWDLFIGGGFHICPFHIKGKLDTTIDNLYKINGGYCLHFVIYNHTSYDYFLQQDENNSPIDHVWQDRLTCIVPLPFIASQLDTFSNISNNQQSLFPKRIRRDNNRLLNYINNNNIKTID
jgi:hypothetical protein